MNVFSQIYEEIETKLPMESSAQQLQPLPPLPPTAHQPLPPAGVASGDYTLTPCLAYSTTTFPTRPESSGEGGYANFPTTPTQSSGEGSNVNVPTTLPAQNSGEGSYANVPTTIPAHSSGEGSYVNLPAILPPQSSSEGDRDDLEAKERQYEPVGVHD